MITEDYCSFEVSKLLRDKGFDEPCWLKYDNEGYLSFNHVGYINSEKPCDDFCALAPTHQTAMKWLRIKHNILLFLLPAQENGKLVYLVEVWTWNEEEGIYESTYAPMPRKEPEKAVEAAIKYCLENLI